MVVFSGASVLNTMSEDLLNYIPAAEKTKDKEMTGDKDGRKKVKPLSCDHKNSSCDECNKENIPPNVVMTTQKKRKSTSSKMKKRNLMRL